MNCTTAFPTFELKVTELPEVQHPSVLGAFNLRNQIIPLVDLSLWLGKKRTGKSEAKVIVTEFNNVTTAFMVSGVNRIHRISWEQVEPPNKYVAAVSNNTVIGVVKLEDRIIFLLDLEKVVANLNPKLGLRLDDLGKDWSNSGYRALVADDSAPVREMLRDLMEKAGFTVEVVSNGRAAWERLEDFKRRCEEGGQPITDFVHVVVSDIEMPVMDGLNLTHRIKTDPMLNKLPVVLFAEGGGGRPGDVDANVLAGLHVGTFAAYAALSQADNMPTGVNYFYTMGVSARF